MLTSSEGTLIQHGQQIPVKNLSVPKKVGSYTVLLQVLNPEYGPLSFLAFPGGSPLKSEKSDAHPGNAMRTYEPCNPIQLRFMPDEF